jgi:hypothetical protein
MKEITPETVGRVRRMLSSFYATWPNPRERQIMAPASSAVIFAGDYSLSELIATENRVASHLLSIPGIVGVGTSLRLNRVKVGFKDQTSLERGLGVLEMAGVPRGILVPEVWGEVVLTSNFTDRIRNTKAGLQIALGRRFDPTDGLNYVTLASHGFTVTTPTGVKYVMTAAHAANAFWGINGKTADTVFQHTYDGVQNNKVGTIAISAPYLQDTNCPQDVASQAYPAYCTQSDVALGQFDSATPDKKVATSMYEGQNGNPGTQSINGFYSISGVLSPEFVKDSSNKGVHKSGFKTGTTTGVIDLPLTTFVILTQPWGAYHYSNPFPTVSLMFYNVTRVTHAGFGGGDSGGPVFAGNGLPYYALGMEVAGQGHLNSDKICDAGTGCSFFFTRWSNIEQDLGYTLNPVTGQ